MSQLRTSLLLDLAGNLARQARAYAGEMEQFGRRSSSALGSLNRVAGAVGSGLDRLGNRYTAFLTGAAGAGAARGLIRLEERLTALGIQGNVGADAIAKLKTQLFQVAQARDIRLNPEKLLSAVDAIVEKTGDLEFARANLQNIGLAIRATGAEGGAIGEILAEFQKMGIKAPAEVLKALDVLNVQGKEGAFTLQNLAALGPRVITAYTSMGRTGVPALREMGAALQMIRMGTGSSEMAATAFEALVRTLGNAQKVKLLQKGGIQVFDPAQAKLGKEVLRPINELMAEIIRRSEGRKTVLSKVFDEEAIRAFNQAAGEFKRTGTIESLDRFMNVQADGTQTLQDSARAAETAAAALEYLHTGFTKFADSKLSEPIRELADLLNGLSPEQLERIYNRLWKIGLLLGGGILVSKGVRFGASLRTLLGGGAAGAAAGGLAGMQIPLPVYVVNRHMSLLPDAWTGGAGGVAGRAAADAAAKISWLGTAAFAAKTGLLALGPALVTAAVAKVSYEVGRSIAQHDAAARDTGDISAELRTTDVLGNPGSRRSQLLRSELSRRRHAGGGNLLDTLDRDMAYRIGREDMAREAKLRIELAVSHDPNVRPDVRVREMTSIADWDLDVKKTYAGSWGAGR